MRNTNGIIYHVFLSFVMHLVSSINDEFYCKVDLGNYEICRNCPTLSERCEIPGRYDGCQCDNIRFTENGKGKHYFNKLKSNHGPLALDGEAVQKISKRLFSSYQKFLSWGNLKGSKTTPKFFSNFFFNKCGRQRTSKFLHTRGRH